jgi:hypothetical protein
MTQIKPTFLTIGLCLKNESSGMSELENNYFQTGVINSSRICFSGSGFSGGITGIFCREVILFSSG